MSLLTDEEISDLAISNPPDVHKYARAIEEAILAKLASAELPEPTYWIWRTDSDFHFWEECAAKKLFDAHSGDKQSTYTADQLIAWGNTRYAQGAAVQLAEKPSGYLWAPKKKPELAKLSFQPKPSVQLKALGYVSEPLYTRRQA